MDRACRIDYVEIRLCKVINQLNREIIPEIFPRR